MGLFIRQNDNRSQLQERLAAELQERARLQMSGAEPLDETKNSKYLQNTEMSASSGIVWLALFAVIVIAVVWFIFFR